MKRYFINEKDEGYFNLIIGTTREIRSLYRTLANKGYTPVFANNPIFRDNAMYGIILDHIGCYYVVNSDSIVRFLVAV